jgi:hypothetical protein
MKKLLLIFMFIVPMVSFGQIMTDTSFINLPYYIAKEVCLDLNSLDSLTEINRLTELELTETQKKVVIQDSIIQTMELKEENYELQISKEQEKYQIVETQNNDLRKDIKKLKTKNTVFNIIGGAIIGGLTYIVVFK